MNYNFDNFHFDISQAITETQNDVEIFQSQAILVNNFDQILFKNQENLKELEGNFNNLHQ
jgi:hypothetical protein